MMKHRWVRGAIVNDRQLSTCPDCGTLRVETLYEPRGDEKARSDAALGVRDKASQNGGRIVRHTEYQRPVYDSGRISAGEPPCMRPPRRPAPW